MKYSEKDLHDILSLMAALLDSDPIFGEDQKNAIKIIIQYTDILQADLEQSRNEIIKLKSRIK